MTAGNHPDPSLPKPGIIGPAPRVAATSQKGGVLPPRIVGPSEKPVDNKGLIETQWGDELRRRRFKPWGYADGEIRRFPWCAMICTVLVVLLALSYAGLVSLESFTKVDLNWSAFKVLGLPQKLYVVCTASYATALLLLVFLFGSHVTWAGWRYYQLRDVSIFRSETEAFRKHSAGWSDERLMRWLEHYLQRLSHHRDDQVRSAVMEIRGKDWSSRDLNQKLSDCDSQLLQRIDQRADTIILNNALGVAIGTAAASAAFDVFIVLWRTFATIEQIAALYGGRPGILGSLRLLRHSMYSVTVAGIADQATSALAGAVGNRALALLSGRLAQGLGNGLMVMRLGYAVKHECRPLVADDSSTLMQQIGRLKNALYKANPANESDSTDAVPEKDT